MLFCAACLVGHYKWHLKLSLVENSARISIKLAPLYDGFSRYPRHLVNKIAHVLLKFNVQTYSYFGCGSNNIVIYVVKCRIYKWNDKILKSFSSYFTNIPEMILKILDSDRTAFKDIFTAPDCGHVTFS